LTTYSKIYQLTPWHKAIRRLYCNSQATWVFK